MNYRDEEEVIINGHNDHLPVIKSGDSAVTYEDAPEHEQNTDVNSIIGDDEDWAVDRYREYQDYLRWAYWSDRYC